MSERSYGDGCSSAHALDLVGERWALLVVRDLLFGPKRFTDLRIGLPHASPNVLSQRLRELEANGVVRRRKLPPPAASTVYELTEWGQALEPVLLGLQRWGAGSPSFSGEVPVGCDAAMLALKNAFRPDQSTDVDGTVEVRFATETFRVTVAGATLQIQRGAYGDVDAVIETDPTTLEAVAFGFEPFDQAVQRDGLRISGDEPLVRRFFTLFPIDAVEPVT